MDLQTAVFNNETDTPLLENVIPLCELAKSLEEAGEFELAEETLSPFWQGLPSRPNTDGLADHAKGELLLRAGSLTGWIGSAKQIHGAQELAKDLVSESASLFSELGIPEKEAEARVDLAICYWREGALDEARVTLRHVLDTLGEIQSEQRLRALLNSAIVEKDAIRDRESLRIYRQAAPQFELSSNHALKGKFHNSYATLLKSLGLAENREEYIDKALVEFAAASFHFEQAGHHRFQARVENNVGYLFANIGRFLEAQDHLDRARRLFVALRDHGAVAYTDDSRAQAFLLEGKAEEAERVARSAVKALRNGGEQMMLVEALTTHGTALARLKQIQLAKSTLDQAVEIAQSAGNPDRGGIAAVTAIEELSSYLSVVALQQYYFTAESLLYHSQNRGIKARLGECARRVLAVEIASIESATKVRGNIREIFGGPINMLPGFSLEMPPGFSLDAEVLRYEGSLIRKALEEAGGSVTRAARMLGVTHQGLAFILNGRHSDLLSIRTPVKKRRRSIIRNH
jgi:tetratricopeptide (TPR) repeat protein